MSDRVYIDLCIRFQDCLLISALNEHDIIIKETFYGYSLTVKSLLPQPN